MANTDAFALKNSGLNAFLFSDVGIEANGSSLTILSILARLGKDPWAEAARWAVLPRAAAEENLTRCMEQMPLCPEALQDARATATRVFQLLPAETQRRVPAAPAGVQKFLPMVVLYVALAIGLLVNVVHGSWRAADAVAAPVAHADSLVPNR